MRTVTGAVMAMLCCALASPVPAQTPFTAAAPPVWAVGDTWTYQSSSQSTTFTFTVLSVTASGYLVRFISSAPDVFPTEVLRFSKDIVGDTATAAWFRPQWPLDKGRSWSYEFERPFFGSPTMYHNAYTVTGSDKVAVPAGAFDAVRLNCEWNRVSLTGKAPLVLAEGQWAFQGSFVVWYAPQVKNYVKIEGVGGWRETHPTVLLSYKLQ